MSRVLKFLVGLLMAVTIGLIIVLGWAVLLAIYLAMKGTP